MKKIISKVLALGLLLVSTSVIINKNQAFATEQNFLDEVSFGIVTAKEDDNDGSFYYHITLNLPENENSEFYQNDLVCGFLDAENDDAEPIWKDEAKVEAKIPGGWERIDNSFVDEDNFCHNISPIEKAAHKREIRVHFLKRVCLEKYYYFWLTDYKFSKHIVSETFGPSSL